MSPTRRPHGTGSIRDRGPIKDGNGKVVSHRWQLRIYGGLDPATNKPRQHVRTVQAKTRRDAAALLQDFARELGHDAPASTRTVAQLLDEFIAHSETRGRAPRTIHEHQREAGVIKGELGRLQVAKLTPRHLDEFYRRLSEGTVKGITRPLAPASVRRHHALISASLAQAVKWGWVVSNVASLATIPPLPNKELVIPSRPEINAIVMEARRRDERKGMLLALAALTGMRRGELCALKWEDVSEDGLRVRRSLYRAGKKRGEKLPKGGRPRDVALDGAGGMLLRAWRVQCEKWAIDADEDPNGLVYVVGKDPAGKEPINPDTLSTFVRRLADDLGLPDFHLHSSRHFVVTEALASGASVRDVATYVGHADPKLTLSVYAHATEERQKSLAAGLASGLGLPQIEKGDATEVVGETEYEDG